MDQVDGIIISTLNTLGCDLEDEISSLSQFGLEEVVSGAVHCLRAIDSQRCAGLSHRLPQNMAQRFRAAAAIAQEIKSLGYSGDLGYQSLLYPNEVDVRRLFSFLLERLPRDAADLAQEPLSGADLLLASARQRLQQQLSRPWLPPHCRAALLKRRGLQLRDSTNSQQNPGEVACIVGDLMPLGETRHLRPYRGYHLMRVGRETDNTNATSAPPCIKNIVQDSHSLLCSVLAAHARQLHAQQLLPVAAVSPGRASSTESDAEAAANELEPLMPGGGQQYLRVPSPSTDSLVTPLSPLSPMANLSLNEDSTPLAGEGKGVLGTGRGGQAETEQNIKELQIELERLEQEKQLLVQQQQETKKSAEKLSSELVSLQSSQQTLQAELVSLQRTLELLPSPQENRARLQAIVDTSDAKMTRLKDQFSAHCSPLQEQLQQLTDRIAARQSEQERLGEEITGLRASRQSLQQEAPRLQAQAGILEERLQARGQAVSRSVYTKRILEITAKVHQQRLVTEAVLVDIRKLQKEINSLAGKIDRCFTVIEEVSYKASWSNSASGTLYRSIINIHEGCNAIVDVIRETGALKRQAAELDEQVMLEERRGTEKALAKLQEDLIAIKQENSTLKGKVAHQLGLAS